MDPPAKPDLAGIHSRRKLFASPGVAVVDFRCRAHVEPMGTEEANPTHAIAFVRKGVFRRAANGEAMVADANHVLFFNGGRPYRYAHPLAGGDECTILELDAGRALEVVARHAPRDAESPQDPFRLGHGLASARAARLHYELLRLVRAGAPRLAVEDALAELMDEAVGSAYRSRDGRGARKPVTASALRRRRDLGEAAKVAVNRRLEALPSLEKLAAELGCSPFHLSRTFHETAGLSLRAYALRLRARRAAALLAAEARDLTELALRLGYADHSHFTNAFREEWGVPPSRFRDAHRAPAGPSKILQAGREREP